MIVDETKKAVLSAISGVDDVMTALRGVVRGQLTGAAKDVSAMTVTGVQAVTDVVSGSVEAAAETGTDVGKAAAAVVEEAINSAGSVGVSASDAATAAVTGAIRGARKVSNEAVGAVTDSLKHVAAVPREVLESALKG